MLTNPSLKSDVLFTEAPASWNTRYLTPDGFECQLTLRGETGQEVLERAQAAMAFLLKTNCTPATNTKTNNRSQNTNEHDSDAATSGIPSNGNASVNGNGNGHDRSYCPIHQCAMKRWEKDGRVWFSHKAGDQWCSGKVKTR